MRRSCLTDLRLGVGRMFRIAFTPAVAASRSTFGDGSSVTITTMTGTRYPAPVSRSSHTRTFWAVPSVMNTTAAAPATAASSRS